MDPGETSLLRQFAGSGDIDAFAQITRLYANMVYGTCVRITGDREAAADATQDTFFALLKGAGQVTGSLGGWLHRVATRRAVDLVRRDHSRRQREQVYAAQMTLETDRWADVSPLLDEAMNEIDAAARDLIIRHFLREQTTVQIAACQGVSQSTISRHLEQALAQLRDRLRAKGVVVAVAALGGFLSQAAQAAAPPAVVAELGRMTVVGSSAVVLKHLVRARTRMAAMIGVPSVLLTGILLYVAPLVAEKFEPENLVRNGGFEQGLTNWQTIFWQQSRATAGVAQVAGTEGQAVKFSIARIGLVDTFEFVHAPVPVKAGHTYAIRFRARSTVTQPIRVLLTKDKKPWTFYGFRASTEIGPRWRTYRLSSRAMVTADDGRIVFRCRGAVGDLWLDDIRFQDHGP